MGDPHALFNTDRARWIAENRASVAAREQWPRVVTGHFWLGKYEPYFPDAFKLVWLREPAARTLSRFFYWKHGPRVQNHELAAAVQAGRISLEEFVELPLVQNQMAGAFLSGYTLSDLDFVGVTEHFAEDLRVLGDRLGWPPVSVPRRRVNESAQYEGLKPSRRLLRRIRRLNREDVELYSQALELRRRRARTGPRT